MSYTGSSRLLGTIQGVGYHLSSLQSTGQAVCGVVYLQLLLLVPPDQAEWNAPVPLCKAMSTSGAQVMCLLHMAPALWSNIFLEISMILTLNEKLLFLAGLAEGFDGFVLLIVHLTFGFGSLCCNAPLASQIL